MNTSTIPPVTTPGALVITGQINLLSKHDRCDKCRAQAFGRVVLKGSGFELLWCAHHLAEHMAEMLVLASKIEDYRAALDSK
jgi:hypothetical protein